MSVCPKQVKATDQHYLAPLPLHFLHLASNTNVSVTQVLLCRILAMEEKPPMQKQSFAYILGWSQEQIAGWQAACKHLVSAASVHVCAASTATTDANTECVAPLHALS